MHVMWIPRDQIRILCCFNDCNEITSTLNDGKKKNTKLPNLLMRMHWYPSWYAVLKAISFLGSSILFTQLGRITYMPLV